MCYRFGKQKRQILNKKFTKKNVLMSISALAGFLDFNILENARRLRVLIKRFL